MLVFFSFFDEVTGTSRPLGSSAGPSLSRHAAFLNKTLLGHDPIHLFTLSVMALVPQWQSEDYVAFTTKILNYQVLYQKSLPTSAIELLIKVKVSCSWFPSF